MVAGNLARVALLGWLAGVCVASGALSAEENFVRGDVDADRRVEITDAITTLRWLFLGESARPRCLDAADADDDGEVTVTDAVFLLQFLFARGERPPFPFPHCAPDPTGDGLECESSPSCSPTFMFAERPFAGDGVVFLVDRSLNMQFFGEIPIAKREIRAALETATGIEEFAIVFFDGGTLGFPPPGDGAAPFSDGTVAAALAFLAEVEPGDVACPRQAFRAAFEVASRLSGERKVIMHIGSGTGMCPNRTERQELSATLEDVAAVNQGRIQVNTVGIAIKGSESQVGFLRELARQNGGTYLHILF